MSQIISIAFFYIVPAHNIFISSENAIVDISGDEEKVFSQSTFINSYLI
jgi:hypothetical protein